MRFYDERIIYDFADILHPLETKGQAISLRDGSYMLVKETSHNLKKIKIHHKERHEYLSHQDPFFEPELPSPYRYRR